MPKPKSKCALVFARRSSGLSGLIPPGKFTTYGSIAVHMNVMARLVAFVMSSLTEQEAVELPWHPAEHSLERRVKTGRHTGFCVYRKSRCARKRAARREQSRQAAVFSQQAAADGAPYQIVSSTNFASRPVKVSGTSSSDFPSEMRTIGLAPENFSVIFPTRNAPSFSSILSATAARK